MMALKCLSFESLMYLSLQLIPCGSAFTKGGDLAERTLSSSAGVSTSYLPLDLCCLFIFTAQLPRGMQVQRNPPSKQLQCLRVRPLPRDLHCTEQTRTGKAGQQGVPNHDCHSLPPQDIRTLWRKAHTQGDSGIFSVGILHKRTILLESCDF